MLLVAGVAIAVGVGYIVHSVHATLRGAATKLSAGAEMVVAAAGQMSSSSQSLSQSATEQAASLEETSASVEQLALMTRKNADATNEVVGHLREVDARANESNQALSDMVTSMAGIQDSSRQVSKIIKTIDEIAFQTNILALNAAVEAARAGTAGMGFAVVADEVRSLAHRSAQAAQDTNELISQSISRAQSGTSSVERLTGSIASIMQSVSNVKRLADDVSVASRQQAAGIEQVSKAVIELEKSTQAIAGTAEEGAAASEELNAHSETVIGVVGQLEILVGSSSTDGAASTPGSDAGALPRPMALALPERRRVYEQLRQRPARGNGDVRVNRDSEVPGSRVPGSRCWFCAHLRTRTLNLEPGTWNPGTYFVSSNTIWMFVLSRAVCAGVLAGSV